VKKHLTISDVEIFARSSVHINAWIEKWEAREEGEELPISSDRWDVIFALSELAERYHVDDAPVIQFGRLLDDLDTTGIDYRSPGMMPHPFLTVGKFLQQLELSVKGDDGWTVTQAANFLSVERGNIEGLVKSGSLRDNGRTGRDRRIDPLSVKRYSKKKCARDERRI